VLVATLDLNGDDPAPNDANDVSTLPHYSDPPLAGIKPFDMVAYIADGRAGVRIINLNDVPTPFVGATVPTQDARAIFAKSHYDAGSSTEPTLEREYLYIADGAGGLRIVNVPDPWSPQPVITVDAGAAVSDLLVANAFEPPKNKAYLYAALGTGECAIVDVSQVTAPQIVQTVPVPVTHGLDIERVRLDRMVDEDGTRVKDTSHQGARPFQRNEMERILDARF
jgi:hypothetical protein